MQITETAAQAILEVMKSKGLNPKTAFLEIGVFEGNLGLGFTRTPIGTTVKKGELSVVVSSQVDTNGVTIDFGEVNGKMGLIFLGEQNVDQSNW